jgi:hypothetical protein
MTTSRLLARIPEKTREPGRMPRRSVFLAGLFRFGTGSLASFCCARLRCGRVRTQDLIVHRAFAGTIRCHSGGEELGQGAWRIRLDMNRLRDGCVGCPTDMPRKRVGIPLPEHMSVMTVHISET